MSGWDRFFIWEGIFDDDDLEAKETIEQYFHYIARAARNGSVYLNNKSPTL